jgi:hypothetical protein
VTSFLATVAVGTVLLALLAGCAAHLARPTGLPEALRVHGLLPEDAVRTAAVVVPAAEALLGFGGATTLLTGHRGGLTGVLCAGSALFAGYALYTRYALTAGRGGPCGCARTELPLSDWITTRAAALALCAATGAALTGPADAAFPDGGARSATALLATLTLALLLWTLPAAMHDPSASLRYPDRRTPPRTPRETTETAGTAGAAGAAGGSQWTS